MSGNLFLCCALLNPLWASSRLIAKICWSNSPLPGSTSLAVLSSSSRPEMKLTSWPLESRWDVWPAMTNGIQRLWLCVSSELPLRGPYTLLLFCPRTMRCLLEQETPGQKAWLSQLMTFLSLSPPNMQEGPAIWEVSTSVNQYDCVDLAKTRKAIHLWPTDS